LVVDPRSLDLHGSRPAEDLTLSGVAITDDQGVPLLVALFSGSLEVVLYLGLQSLGEHPARSLSGDLVQIEQALFAVLCILVYSSHSGVSFPPTPSTSALSISS
jgi:hypothetical protein